MCELPPEVLDGRRATDLVSSRRDQPTPWRRLTLAFLAYCHNKRTRAPDEAVEKSRSEMLIDALKLDFQMKKWTFGLGRLQKEGSSEQPRKRAKIEDPGGSEGAKRAVEALERAKAERRAYDRCVALQRAYELEGSLEQLEEEVKEEQRMVKELEEEEAGLEVELRLLGKKRKAAMICADEIRWGRWK